ncbi:hypothetical protein ACQKWADRAFT_307776 [Trichoderma austrokoningii]
MASSTTTIHDVKQIFQGFDENDSFQAVLSNEDFFTRVCNGILRPVYRYATQSEQQNQSQPKTRIIQEIATQEGISHELPSTLEHTATSETSPSSKQSATQEHTNTSGHNQTLETCPSSERNAIQEPLSATPVHVLVPDISSSPGRSATHEHSETSDATSVTDSSSVSDGALCAKRSSFLGGASGFISNSPRSLDIVSAPDSGIELSDNQGCAPSSRPRATDSAIDISGVFPGTPRTESSYTVKGPENGTADEDRAPSSSPQAEISATIKDLVGGTADEDRAPSSSPRADISAIIEDPISGTADEDCAPSSSPRAEISATTEQDQIIPEDQAIFEDETEDLYANRPNTKTISSKFTSWIEKPEEFWGYSGNNTWFKEEGDASTIVKAFVQDAMTTKADAEHHKLRYRFTSILVYQSFLKTMDTNAFTQRLCEQFFQLMDIPVESRKDCLMLLYGGKHRVEFDEQISPNEIDHGLQCLTDLDDNIWDYKQHSSFRVKFKATVAELKSQDISSWSKTSGAQSAANQILFYGQKLLDLVDWQTKRNRTKEGEGEGDSTTQRKRELETSSNVDSFNKRIRTHATTSPLNLQFSQPNIHQSTTTHINPTVFQPNQPTSGPTEYPFDLSIYAQSSPSLDSSLPFGISHGIGNFLQQDEDAARNTDGCSDEVPAVDESSSAKFERWWQREYNMMLCDPLWSLSFGSPEDSRNPQDLS